MGWCYSGCPSGAAETGETGSPLSVCARGELFFLYVQLQAQTRQREGPQLTPAGTTQQPALTKEMKKLLINIFYLFSFQYSLFQRPDGV